jgi:hypothetical protein
MILILLRSTGIMSSLTLKACFSKSSEMGKAISKEVKGLGAGP